MSQSYYYEYERDGSYCYADSDVLINKLGITDGKLLYEVERRITSLRISEILQTPVIGALDYEHLKAIHKSIFSDIYNWAGQPRTVDIAKGNIFCLSRNLDVYAASIFNKLKAENYLMDTSRDKIVPRLSFYLSEINVLHPFREGNGRTQRVIIEYLATTAGYHLDFSKVSAKEMIEASALAFSCKYDAMNKLLSKIISAIDEKTQERYISSFVK